MLNAWQQFSRVIFILLLIIAIGIIGYMAIEDWSFTDAFYMTIITISTVGYSEVHSLSSAGRIFSIVLVIGGVGVMFYGLTSIVQYFIEGHLTNILGRRRMKEKISKLNLHVILCGYGREGTEVASVLKSENKKFVVIDNNREAVVRATTDGCPYMVMLPAMIY